MAGPSENPTGNWLPGAISAGGSFLGGLFNRLFSAGDIRRMNEYNSPSAQLARLRKAGLPFAAFMNNQAGQQSALPQSTDLGLNAAGGHLGGYIQRKIDLQQLEILKAETDHKRSLARVENARANVLLSGVGENVSDTYLSRGITTQQGILDAQKKGAELGNIIQGEIANSQAERVKLELDQKRTELANMLKSGNLTDLTIEGKEIENAIARVTEEYRERMTQAEFIGLLKRNKLLSEQIEGAILDNAASAMRNYVQAATQDSEINQKNLAYEMSKLEYSKVKQYFTDYNQYMEFVKDVQRQYRDPTFKGGLRAAVSMAYTTITGLSGQTSSLLQFIK